MLQWNNPTYHQWILHTDYTTVKDWRRNRWNFQLFAIPGFCFARWQGFPTQVGNKLFDFLHFPFGIKCLCLVNGCLWHHHTGRAVLNLSKDLNWFTWNKAKFHFFLYICKATEANCHILCIVTWHWPLLAMLYTALHPLMLAGVRSPWGKSNRKLHRPNKSTYPLTIWRHSKLTKLVV